MIEVQATNFGETHYKTVTVLKIKANDPDKFSQTVNELLKSSFYLDWQGNETSLNFPKLLNKKEERKVLKFLKELEKRVEFEYQFTTSNYDENDPEFWVYDRLLRRIVKEFAEHFEIHEITRFNASTQIQNLQELFGVTEMQEVEESNTFKQIWSVWQAEIVKGLKVFIVSKPDEPLQAGQLYLRKLSPDHPFFNDLEHAKKANLEKLLVNKSSNAGRDLTIQELIAKIKEEHEREPKFFELVQPVPLDEIFKLTEPRSFIYEALAAGGKVDPRILLHFAVDIVYPSPSCPRKVMEYNPHAITITNPKVGKTTLASKIGIVFERPTVANLIGFSTADRKKEGLLHDQYKTAYADELSDSEDFKECARGLMSLMEKGSVYTARGLGIPCVSKSNLHFMGNPDPNNLFEGELYYLTLFKKTIEKINTNARALGSRIGRILFGDDFKPYTPPENSLDDETLKRQEMILQTISYIASAIFSTFFNVMEVRNWLSKRIRWYEEKLRVIHQKLRELDSLVAEFVLGHIDAYRHIRGGALRLAVIELLDELFEELKKEPQAIKDQERLNAILSDYIDKLLDIAEDKLKQICFLNLESLNRLVKILQNDEIRQNAAAIEFSNLPQYVQIFLKGVTDHVRKNGRNIIPLEEVKPFLKPHLPERGRYKYPNKVLERIAKNRQQIKFDFLQVDERSGIIYTSVDIEKLLDFMKSISGHLTGHQVDINRQKTGHLKKAVESSILEKKDSKRILKNGLDTLDTLDTGSDDMMSSQDTNDEGKLDIHEITSMSTMSTMSSRKIENPSERSNSKKKVKETLNGMSSSVSSEGHEMSSDWTLENVFAIGSKEDDGGTRSVDIDLAEYLDDLPENIRIQGLIEIWQERLASSSSKHNAVTTFWELAKSQYRSEDLCRADILNHFEEIGLPQWFKRELGVKTTLQDVLGKKLGWG